MELREYLQIINKYRNTFFITWGLILFLTLFTIFVQPTIYEGEQILSIMRTNVTGEITVSKEYDYYYQLESNRQLAGILIAALKDKYLLNTIFSSCNIDEKKSQCIAITQKEKKWIISHLQGEIFDGGYVKIKIRSHNKKIIVQFSEKFTQQMKDRVGEIGKDKNRLISLNIAPIIISQQGKPYFLVTIITFFSGLLVSIFVVLGIYYFKESDSTSHFLR